VYRLAYRYSKEIIFYFDSAGNKYVASGGNLAWRINNPGLLHSRSHFSRKYGSIGSCGSYAIFSSPRDGRKALSAWLQSKKYYNSTLKTIATHYQQSTPNKFLSRLSDLSKILPTTKINSLSTLEFDHLLICIEKLCDFSSIGNESLLLLPKIIAKIENGVNEDTYLIEDNTIISKEKAIELVLAHRLDAVIVHEQNNKMHLRSRPHHSFKKIKINAKESFSVRLESQEIATLMRVIGEKRHGQCIWGFINGIDNTKQEALASATLISQIAKGEQVLSMQNDTIWWGNRFCPLYCIKILI